MSPAAPEALLCGDCVLANVEATGTLDLMQAVAIPLAAASGIDAREIAHALLKRERLGSTGLGGGVAVPHARFSGIDRCITAFASTASPLDFAAPDSQPADLFFILLSPEQAGADHLTALSAIGRFFRDESLMTLLRAAPGSAELRQRLVSRGWCEAA